MYKVYRNQEILENIKNNNNTNQNLQMNQFNHQKFESPNINDSSNNPSNMYTIPGILKFIQSEWAKFELERAQWKVEKAELTAKISSLQGQQQGQINIRRDLVRRIKMLEFALKQERQRYYYHKTGMNLDLHSDGNSSQSSYDSSDSNDEDGKKLIIDENQHDGQINGNVHNNEKRDEILDPEEEKNKIAKKVVKKKNKKERQRKIKEENDKKFGLEEGKEKESDGQTEFYWKHGRQMLRDYLNELGYTDTILHVRAKRLQNLLAGNDLNIPGLTKDLEACNIDSNDDRMDVGDKPSIENESLDLNKGDNNEPLDSVIENSENLPNLTTMRKRKSPEEIDGNSAENLQLIEDFKAEQLAKKNNKNFQNNVDGKLSTYDALFNKLKGPIMYGINDPELNSTTLKEPNSNNWWNPTNNQNNQMIGRTIRMGNNEWSSYNMADQNKMGELNNIHIEPDNIDDPMNPISNEGPFVSPMPKPKPSSLWDVKDQNKTTNYQTKFFLRGHYEPIRDVAFHPDETALISASDDGTLKLWNLMGSHDTGRKPIDIDPVYSFRMFDSPVLSCCFSHGGYNSKSVIDTCTFVGDALGKMYCFNTPNINSDIVSSFDPAQTIYTQLNGHTDAIWSLSWNKFNCRLASAAADGSVKIWNPMWAEEYYNRVDEVVNERGINFELSPKFLPEEEDDLLEQYNSKIKESGEGTDEFDDDSYDADKWMRWPVIESISTIVEDDCGKTNKANVYVTPNRVEWLNNNTLVVSFTNGNIKLYDVGAEKCLSTISTFSHLENGTIPKDRDLINAISVNQSLGIVGAVYEDHYARIFDVNSNKLISSIVAHQDAATAISISPTGLNFVTGSASNTIRIWSMESKKCIQEIAKAHDNRLDESVTGVCFHPTRSNFMASCGIDSIVKIYQC